MADRSQKSSRIIEKRECLLKQQMVLSQPALPSWPCTRTHVQVEALPLLNPDGTLQFRLSKTTLSMKMECVGAYETQMEPPKLPDHLWLSSF